MTLDAAGFQRVHRSFVEGDFDGLRRELEAFGDFPNAVPDLAIGLPLVYAIYHGPLGLIEQLLDAGADTNGSDGDGFPPLIAALTCAVAVQGASSRGDVGEVLGLLLDRGADIDGRGINDYTPLHLAVELGIDELVELLLRRGADPDAVTRIDNMETPLEIAEAHGHTAIAERLRPRTTRVDWQRATREGDVSTLRRMAAAGYEVDTIDGNGQTALTRSAHAGHLEAVEWLISQGARLDHTAKFRLSALMLAVIAGHPAVARSLVRAGADISLRGSGAPGFANKTAADLADDGGDARLAAFIRSHGT